MTFSQKMEGADVGLFFYAGHGIQISDRNYLIPTDAQLAHPRDVELALIELDTILKQMERETETRIIILDACRDNPVARNPCKTPRLDRVRVLAEVFRSLLARKIPAPSSHSPRNRVIPRVMALDAIRHLQARSRYTSGTPSRASAI